MVPNDETKWKIEIFRDKLRHSLSARFFLRFHVSLILLFTIFVGWLVDVAWLSIGLKQMGLRYVISIVFAYVAFLFGVYLWVEYSGIREFIKIRKAAELVGDDVPRKPENRFTSWEGASGPAGFDLSPAFLDGEGCIIAAGLFFAAIIAFYFFGGYVFANATSFFADIVLELLLAAGLLKGINRYESSGWILSVLNATYWSLVFTITVAILFAWWAHAYFPTATTLPEVIRQWRG